MTNLPTAEWCHYVAMLYDGRSGLQRSAGQYREAHHLVNTDEESES